MFKWLRKENEWVKSERQRIVDDILGIDGLDPDDFQKLGEALIKLRTIVIERDMTEFKTKLIGFDISIKDYK